MAKKKPQQKQTSKPKVIRSTQNPPAPKIRNWEIMPTRFGKGEKAIDFYGSKTQARKKAQKHFDVGTYKIVDPDKSLANY